MLTLAGLNQLTAGGRFPHTDCGETCECVACHLARVAATVPELEALAHSPATGTYGGELAAGLRSKGVQAQEVRGDTADVIRSTGGLGADLWIFLIDSDHFGNPQPGSGLGHWCLTNGVDVMNPIGGRVLPGALPAYLSAAVNDVVAITIPQELPVSIDDNRADSRLAYFLMRGDEPSVAELMSRDGRPSRDGIVSEILDSTENSPHPLKVLYSLVDELPQLIQDVAALKTTVAAVQGQENADDAANAHVAGLTQLIQLAPQLDQLLNAGGLANMVRDAVAAAVAKALPPATPATPAADDVVDAVKDHQGGPQ